MMRSVGTGERRTVGVAQLHFRAVPQPRPRESRCAGILTSLSVKAPSLDAGGHPRCPAATSRRSSSPARCSPSRRCWSPTSPPRAWTSVPAPRSTRSCGRRRRGGVPVVVCFLGRQGARGPVRPGAGDVARSCRRDAGRQTMSPSRRIVSAAVTSTAEAVSVAAARRAAGSSLAPVHDRATTRPSVLLLAVIVAARRATSPSERPLPVRIQHLHNADRGDGRRTSSRWVRTSPCSPAASTCRSGPWLGSWSWWRPSSSMTASPADHGDRGPGDDGRGRGGGRCWSTAR